MTSSADIISSFHDPDVPDLASALRMFEASTQETAGRKARVRAAVAMCSRLLKKPANEIPAQATFLMRQFQRFRRGTPGLTAKSIANCKSELRYLMRRARGRGRRSDFRPLTPAFLNLKKALGDGQDLWKLSRFLAFCSGEGVAPTGVDDAVVERFRAALIAAEELDKPEPHIRAAIRAWNRAANRVKGWPQTELTLPPARQRPRWTIEPAKFPAAFRQDAEAWFARLSRVDCESEDGPRRALRPATLNLRRDQIFKAASALAFSGRPIESITRLACLVEIDAFKALMRYLRERQGGKPSEALHLLATALTSMARHHVRVDEDTLNRLRRICSNYDTDESGPRSRTRKRLEAFEDERMLGALLHLPQRLLREASEPRIGIRRVRVLAQVAVALEIELFAPLRAKNLSALNYDQHIQVIELKRATRWILRYERDDAKNRELLTYELPAESVSIIQRALRLYGQTNGYLFPGQKAGQKGRGLLSEQVKREVERCLGTEFNLHLVRPILACLQIKENPKGIEGARAILADRDEHVIRKHYTAAADRHLIEGAQDTIQKVRIRTAPMAPAPKRMRRK